MQTEVPESNQNQRVIPRSAGEDARAEQGTLVMLCREPCSVELRAAPEGPQLGHPRLDSALRSEHDAGGGSVGGLGLTQGPGRPDTAACHALGKPLVDMMVIWSGLRKCCLSLVRNAEQNEQV